MARPSDPIEVRGWVSTAAQVVLGPAVGDHLDAVVAACDQVERGLVRVHGPALGDCLDRQAERVLEPRLRRRDLDLVPAEEQAVAPVFPDLPALLRAGQALDDGRRAAVLRPAREGAARDSRCPRCTDRCPRRHRHRRRAPPRSARARAAPSPSCAGRRPRDARPGGDTRSPARRRAPRSPRRAGRRCSCACGSRTAGRAARPLGRSPRARRRSADIAGGNISPVDTPAAPSSRQASMAATSARRSASSRGRAASPATAIRSDR